jgi:lipopolysaccharide export system protein LptA
LAALPLAAQQADNRKLIEVVHVDVIKSLQYNGKTIDRLIGNVQLMHNGALMSCDSAYKFSSSEFDAYSRVVIIQNSTRLYGDALHYNGNTNIAEVRGNVVRLLDSTATLRTQYLDFNTKENVGHFFNGGTIANSGSLIESIHGHYYSNDKLFVFTDSVEIHNETYDIQCDAGNYNTRTDIATFTAHTNIWHKDGFLSCDYGWYDKIRDFFYFSQNAYIQSKEQEIWADSVFYDRRNAMGDLFGHVQLLDTVQQSIAFGDEAHFFENPQRVTLTRNPSVAYYTIENNKPDTLFARADTLRFVTECHPFYCKKDTVATPDSLTPPNGDNAALPAAATGDSARRSVDGGADSLSFAVADSSIVAAAPQEEIPDVSPPADSVPPAPPADTLQFAESDSDVLSAADTALSVAPDSVQIAAPLPDSLSAATDSLAAPLPDSIAAPLPDSTIRKLFAHFNVRSFRQDVQALCDSFVYSSLDSLGRMFGRPVMWHERQQISSKEIHFFNDPQKKKLIRADFLESGFVIMHESDTFYYQLKGRDIIAHFRNNDLYRVDVLGGAQTVFYSEEDSVIVEGNYAESERMQIDVQKRKFRRVKYYVNQSITEYPLDQFPQEKAILKGFEWRAAERPKSRWEICTELPRASRRQQTATISKPTFPITKRIDKL